MSARLSGVVENKGVAVAAPHGDDCPPEGLAVAFEVDALHEIGDEPLGLLPVLLGQPPYLFLIHLEVDDSRRVLAVSSVILSDGYDLPPLRLYLAGQFV